MRGYLIRDGGFAKSTIVNCDIIGAPGLVDHRYFKNLKDVKRKFKPESIPFRVTKEMVAMDSGSAPDWQAYDFPEAYINDVLCSEVKVHLSRGQVKHFSYRSSVNTKVKIQPEAIDAFVMDTATTYGPLITSQVPRISCSISSYQITKNKNKDSDWAGSWSESDKLWSNGSPLNADVSDVVYKDLLANLNKDLFEACALPAAVLRDEKEKAKLKAMMDKTLMREDGFARRILPPPLTHTDEVLNNDWPAAAPEDPPAIAPYRQHGILWYEDEEPGTD